MVRRSWIQYHQHEPTHQDNVTAAKQNVWRVQKLLPLTTGLYHVMFANARPSLNAVILLLKCMTGWLMVRICSEHALVAFIMLVQILPHEFWRTHNESPLCLYDVLETRFATKGLWIAHLNARSLLYKLSEIKLLSYDSKTDILAITEIHLDEKIPSASLTIDG